MIFNLILILFIIVIYFLILNVKSNLKKDERKTLFLKIVFIILFILVASREMTRGNDTQMYLNLFQKCANLRWGAVAFDGYFEGGYLIFNVLISYISTSNRFFMIVMSAIFNFICYYFIKKNSKNYLLSTIMYVCLLFFYTSMSMMRQFFALVIVLSGFKFVKEKKLIKYILTIVAASFIHSSVWVALLLYPLYHVKYSNKKALLIIALSVIVTINIEPIINFVYGFLGRTNYYTDRIGSDNLANTLYTIVYFIMFLFAAYETKKKQGLGLEGKESSFYLFTLLFSMAINMIATNMNVLERAALYFEFLSIIALPNVIEGGIKNSGNKKIVYILTSIFLITYASVIMYFRPEWNSAFDYKSCFINDTDKVCK